MLPGIYFYHDFFNIKLLLVIYHAALDECYMEPHWLRDR